MNDPVIEPVAPPDVATEPHPVPKSGGDETKVDEWLLQDERLPLHEADNFERQPGQDGA